MGCDPSQQCDGLIRTVSIALGGTAGGCDEAQEAECVRRQTLFVRVVRVSVVRLSVFLAFIRVARIHLGIEVMFHTRTDPSTPIFIL